MRHATQTWNGCGRFGKRLSGRECTRFLLQLQQITTNLASLHSSHLVSHSCIDQKSYWGLPWWLNSKESTCQCRRHGFDPWFRKIPPAAEELSPCASTTDPGLQSPCVSNTEARMPCILCSATRAATAVRNPCIATRDKPTQQQRPSKAQNRINT